MIMFQNEVNQILQTVIKPGEVVKLAACGWDRSTEAAGTAQAALRYFVTKSTTGDYKSYDYMVVAKTDRQVYFIPAKIKGTFSIRLVQNEGKNIEAYNVTDVQGEVVAVNEKGGIFSRPSIDLRFLLPNQQIKLIQFYDEIGAWKSF